jgi:hypothetical protein
MLACKPSDASGIRRKWAGESRILAGFAIPDTALRVMFTTQDFLRAHPGGRRPVRSCLASRRARLPERSRRGHALIAKLNPAPNSDWRQQVFDLKLPEKPFDSERLTRCRFVHLK